MSTLPDHRRGANEQPEAAQHRKASVADRVYGFAPRSMVILIHRFNENLTLIPVSHPKKAAYINKELSRLKGILSLTGSYQYASAV